jgi:mono/diheme cytochrome c family protein
MRALIRLLPLLMIVLVACSPEELDFAYDDLPPGDPARGAELYVRSSGGSASCQSCHSLDGVKGAGPPVDGYAGAAGERVEGKSAGVYTFESLLRPSKHLVRGYSNIMPSDYADKLSRQEIADLIAYMLTLQ